MKDEKTKGLIHPSTFVAAGHSKAAAAAVATRKVNVGGSLLKRRKNRMMCNARKNGKMKDESSHRDRSSLIPHSTFWRCQEFTHQLRDDFEMRHVAEMAALRQLNKASSR